MEPTHHVTLTTAQLRALLAIAEQPYSIDNGPEVTPHCIGVHFTEGTESITRGMIRLVHPQICTRFGFEEVTK